MGGLNEELPEKNSLLLENATEKHSWYGVRHTQMLLAFFALSIGYAMRVNLSVGIRAMTDPHASKNPDIPTYNWENTSTILSSFFWGYIMLQILAGSLAQKYGPKWFLGGAMVINCVACLITPLVAYYLGSSGVMTCRVLQGLSQGFFFPSVHTLFGKWIPANERTKVGTFVYAGVPFGTITGMSLTGVISASWVGWPVSFYVFGGMGLTWIVVWCFYGYNSPSDHPDITEKEKYFIQASLEAKEEKKNLKVPWKNIATSLPLWAILIGQSGQNWGFSTLLTQIPTYLNKVIGFPMEQNGFLSSAPYLANFLVSLAVGPVSDMLINKKILSRGASRKVFQSIGVLVPAVALVVLGYIPKENVSVSVTLLIIAVGANAAVNAGFQVNHVDLSTNYAGILMGIANGTSNICSILGPLAVQAIVPDARQSEQSLWRIVFIVAAVFYVLTDIFYVISASGEEQSWNNFDSEQEIQPEKIKYIEECKSDKENAKV